MGKTDQPARFLSAGQAADRLGVNVSTIGRWVKSERIEAASLPSGGYAIPVREIERIEAERSLSKKEPPGGEHLSN